jgi:hypothetical protein
MSYSFVRTNSDVINYGHISAIDGVSQLTLSFWYQAGDDGAVDYCGVMSQINGVNGLSIDVQNTDDASLIYAFRGGGNKNFIRLTSPLTVGVWKHVYVVFDGTQATEGNRVRVWIDGTEITSWDTANADTTIGTTAVDFLFGYNGYHYRTMKLAEVAMWIGESVTTGTVISDLASGVIASTANPTGLDFHVRMNSSGDVNDSAGSLTGTVTGATYSTDHPTMSGGTVAFVPQVIMVL